MKPIVHVPNTVLTTPSTPVLSFDKQLAKLIQRMKAALRATENPKGVGLAAPQIGEPFRVFLTRPAVQSDIRVFINSKIVKQSEELTDGVPERENKLEGCLSIPAVWGAVRRSTTLTLTFQDEKGIEHTENFSGFIATIIQHEVDHLNGVLFTKRAVEQKGKLYQTVKNDDGKEILEEISLP